MIDDPNPPVDDEANDANLPDPELGQNHPHNDPKNDEVPREAGG